MFFQLSFGPFFFNVKKTFNSGIVVNEALNELQDFLYTNMGNMPIQEISNH